MQLQVVFWPKHTWSAPIAFSYTLGSHQFMKDSLFHRLLLSVYRCFYFYHLEIRIKNFHWTLLLSSTSVSSFLLFIPLLLLSYPPLLPPLLAFSFSAELLQSCFQVLHSISLMHFFRPCNLTFTLAAIYPGWRYSTLGASWRHSYAFLLSDSVSVIQKVLSCGC